MARAVWQRAANRYFIQEDAKRAPKLTCCPSISSAISKIDTKLVDPADLNDEKSFCSNLETDSKWWIQLQPDYLYRSGFISEDIDLLKSQKFHQFVENQDDSSISSIDSLSSKGCYEFVQMDSVELPWWQTAAKDDLGSFVSKKSHIMQAGLEAQKIKRCQKGISQGGLQPDMRKTKILEALCHSQTRAREAEIAAKKAYAEKERVIKLVFRQASQLFAYRQWIYVLQLENLCYQMKNKKSDPLLSVVPVSCSKFGEVDKNLKNVVPVNGKRTRTKRGFRRYGHDLGECAVIFVVGLGIVGAGLVLGWTVGWLLI